MGRLSGRLRHGDRATGRNARSAQFMILDTRDRERAREHRPIVSAGGARIDYPPYIVLLSIARVAGIARRSCCAVR